MAEHLSDPARIHELREHLSAIKLLLELIALENPPVRTALLAVATRLNDQLALLEAWDILLPRPLCPLIRNQGCLTGQCYQRKMELSRDTKTAWGF